MTECSHNIRFRSSRANANGGRQRLMASQRQRGQMMKRKHHSSSFSSSVIGWRRGACGTHRTARRDCMAIDILSSDDADRCRSNFGSLILHECRSKSDFDQHLARLPKQLFLVYNAELRRAGMEDRMASAMRTQRELIDTNRY